MQVEEQILDAGAEIIWVLETDSFLQLGTAQGCRNLVDSLGSDKGWCVGDADTSPTPGTFDNSPFSISRGFDIVVVRDTMVIEYSTNHGTPAGNENITGEQLLAQIQMIADSL